MSIRKKKKRLPIFGERVRQEEAQTSTSEKQPVTPTPASTVSATISPKSKR